MKKIILILSFSFTFLINIAYALSPANISQIYIFGDSLSDAGYQNLLVLPDNKSATYTTPGGAVWPQWLTQDKGWSQFSVTPNNMNPPSGNDHVSGTLNGNDYAAGGAAISGQGIGIAGYNPPSVQQQVNAYLLQHGGVADPKALYVLWAGSNDLFIAAASEGPQPATTFTRADNAASELLALSLQLKAAGAQHIVVFGLPDFSITPLGLADPAAGQMLGLAALSFNIKLYNGLGGTGIGYIDTYFLLDELHTNSSLVVGGQTFSFVNVSTPACTGFDPSALTCIPLGSAGTTYAFEDEIHPTTTLHHVIALTLQQVVEQHM